MLEGRGSSALSHPPLLPLRYRECGHLADFWGLLDLGFWGLVEKICNLVLG